MAKSKLTVDAWFRKHGSRVQLAVVGAWLVLGFGGWIVFRAGWIAPLLIVALPPAAILFLWCEKPPRPEDAQ